MSNLEAKSDVEDGTGKVEEGEGSSVKVVSPDVPATTIQTNTENKIELERAEEVKPEKEDVKTEKKAQRIPFTSDKVEEVQAREGILYKRVFLLRLRVRG